MRFDTNLATLTMLFGAGANAAPLNRRDAEAVVHPILGSQDRYKDASEIADPRLGISGNLRPAVWEKRDALDARIPDARIVDLFPNYAKIGGARLGAWEKREAQPQDFNFVDPVRALGDQGKPEPNDFFGRKAFPDFGLQQKREAQAITEPPFRQVGVEPGNNNPPYVPNFEKRNRDSWAQPYPPFAPGGRQPFDPFPGDGGYTGPILLNGNEKRDADASLVEARGLTNHLPLPGPIQWNFNDKREAIVYHPGFLNLPGSKPWNGPQLAGGPEKRNQRAWIQP
ncbi:uncharacterized protein RHO25_012076 [Cercospora beticola]|uniref:Uncharacterized protein n=1 Tax=Cercospora beticola TaxID=122368 RepID=A0ABZ0P6L6_CERBT|nr:hypothetical protein RHO25_012076 [Cercospora beticola]CAK1367401.1 unnamed protein product [Cercospora beticola]